MQLWGPTDRQKLEEALETAGDGEWDVYYVYLYIDNIE